MAKRTAQETPLKAFVIHYVQADSEGGETSGLFWRCDAKDYNHAIEQLKDSVRRENATLIFHELYK